MSAPWVALAIGLAIVLALALSWALSRRGRAPRPVHIRPPRAGLLLLLPLLAACTNAAAVKHAERLYELNRGNAGDPAVHPDARRVSLENADAWAVQLEALDDRPLPADVAERVANGGGR